LNPISAKRELPHPLGGKRKLRGGFPTNTTKSPFWREKGGKVTKPKRNPNEKKENKENKKWHRAFWSTFGGPARWRKKMYRSGRCKNCAGPEVHPRKGDIS